MSQNETLFQRIADAAKRHGEESEPEHEAGDLLEALRAALALMTSEQLHELENDLEETLEEWGS